MKIIVQQHRHPGLLAIRLWILLPSLGIYAGPPPLAIPSRALPPVPRAPSLPPWTQPAFSKSSTDQNRRWGRSNRPQRPSSAAAELGPAGWSGRAPARLRPGGSGRREAEVPQPVREGGGAADDKKTVARPDFGAQRESSSKDAIGASTPASAARPCCPPRAAPRHAGGGAQRAAGLGWRGAEAGWEDEEGGRR